VRNLITRANLVASDRCVVVLAFAGMGAGFCGLTLVSGVGLLAVFLTLIIIGFMFARSTLTFELSRTAAINRQGMIMGFNQSLMSGANITDQRRPDWPPPLFRLGAVDGRPLRLRGAAGCRIIAGALCRGGLSRARRRPPTERSSVARKKNAR
jgi:hypothetical protein